MRSATLFEPWGMGDAVIALSLALQAPQVGAIACQSKWQPVLRALCEVQGLPCPELLAVDLSYVGREKSAWTVQSQAGHRGSKLLSIRGDVRDLRAARQAFPRTPITMRGWLSFVAKRSRLVDLPYRRGMLRVLSRYERWARLLRVPWAEAAGFFAAQPARTGTHRTVIHVGAQWQARQYPHVAELASLLRPTGEVQIVAGPSDPLPAGVQESHVLRLVGRELVQTMHGATHVIANDSGPMHVAAVLRRRTLAVSNHGAMGEWLPPGASLVESNGNRGYRTTGVRWTDSISEGWPTPDSVFQTLQTML